MRLTTSLLTAVALILTLTPAVLADPMTFQAVGGATITLPSIVDIVYTVTAGGSPAFLNFSAMEVGNAGLVYDVNNQSFSFENGTISETVAPASGWASPPGNAYITQNVGATISVANNSSSTVTVPISMSLTYLVDAEAGSAPPGWFAYAYSGLAIYDLSQNNGEPLLGTGASCIDPLILNPTDGCGFSADVTNTPGPTTGPFFGTNTETLDVVIPADTEVNLTENLFVGGSLNPPQPPPTPAPEPSTFALLGTGLLGLAGIARRKFLSQS